MMADAMDHDATVYRHEFRFRCSNCHADIAGARVASTGPLLQAVTEAVPMYCSTCAEVAPPRGEPLRRPMP